MTISPRLHRLFFQVGPFILAALVLLPRFNAERSRIAKAGADLNTQITTLDKRLGSAEERLGEAASLEKHVAWVADFKEAHRKPPPKEPEYVDGYENGNPSVRGLPSTSTWSMNFEWSVRLKNIGTRPSRPSLYLQFLDHDGYLVYDREESPATFEPDEERVVTGRFELPTPAGQHLRTVELQQWVSGQ